MIMMDRWS